MSLFLFNPRAHFDEYWYEKDSYDNPFQQIERKYTGKDRSPYDLVAHVPTHKPSISRQNEKVIQDRHAECHDDRSCSQAGDDGFHTFMVLMVNDRYRDDEQH